MADTEIPATALVASAAPVADAVVSTPAIVESAPVAAPATESVVAEIPVAAEPSLLAAEPTAEIKPEVIPEVKPEATEAKPEEKKPEAEVKPETKEGEQPSVPTYEAFKLPENTKVDEKAMGEFTGLLGQLESAKGDHKATQEVGQKLVDLFTSKMGEATQQMTDYYVTLHNQDKQKMAEELKKDPYFGAGGDATAQTRIKLELAGFLNKNVPKEDLNNFRKFVDEKGIGDSLAVAKLINHLKAKIDRYETEGAKMLPGTKPQSAAPSHPGKGILQKMYGQKQ